MNFPSRLDITVRDGGNEKRSRWDMSSRSALPRGFCGHVGRRCIDALRLGRRVAQNAPMKTVIYMVGALALIVIGSITWSTMLLGSH
jgi:hypothetical protein